MANIKIDVSNEFIKVKDTKIYLNNEIQYSKSKRQFKYVGTKRKATLPEKYINGGYKSHWLYAIRYIDTDETVLFEFGYEDQFVGKCDVGEWR